MYISDEDYSKGIEFVKEKADAYIRKQAEYVDPVISLQEEASKNYLQAVEDLQSKSRFLPGMESHQVQQTMLMTEGLMVIQNQLTAIIKLLNNLCEVMVDTNVMTHYVEINTNLVEENTSLIEENTRQIEQNTSKH